VPRGRTRPVLVNCDDGPSKKYWIEHGWKDRQVTAEQLYDLMFDPENSQYLITSKRFGTNDVAPRV